MRGLVATKLRATARELAKKDGNTALKTRTTIHPAKKFFVGYETALSPLGQLIPKFVIVRPETVRHVSGVRFYYQRLKWAFMRGIVGFRWPRHWGLQPVARSLRQLDPRTRKPL